MTEELRLGPGARLAHGRDGYLSSGTVGAMQELLASADLMRRGLPVFRALSPSCPSDLVVLLDGRTVRVEVRTGHLLALDPSTVNCVLAPRDRGNFDMLAVVVDREVFYFPDLLGANPGMRLGPRPASRLAAWGLLPETHPGRP